MRDFAMHLFLAAALLSVGCARTPSAPTTSRLEPRALGPTPADCACPLPVIAQSFVACCLVLPPPAHRHAPLRREGARL
ncbi:MAG: hypothetical protein KDD82_30975, partial [Planctomycetes bacterium]|nr:hypothetical protein [Planctomycetota bacterium]